MGKKSRKKMIRYENTKWVAGVRPPVQVRELKKLPVPEGIDSVSCNNHVCSQGGPTDLDGGYLSMNVILRGKLRELHAIRQWTLRRWRITTLQAFSCQPKHQKVRVTWVSGQGPLFLLFSKLYCPYNFNLIIPHSCLVWIKFKYFSWIHTLLIVHIIMCDISR